MSSPTSESDVVPAMDVPLAEDATLPAPRGPSGVSQPGTTKKTASSTLKRTVSFNNQSAFASVPSSNDLDRMEFDRDGFTTKKHAIIMVGLPARGKSHIGRSLRRYLNWLGFTCDVFNCGSLRRNKLHGNQSAEFFDPDNEQCARMRADLAQQTLEQMIDWLETGGGMVGIYDATNNRRERRKNVKRTLEARKINVLFLESICTDLDIVEKNIMETKLTSPDYAGMDAEAAVEDFKKRIEMYEKRNETLSESENASFIKVINVGKQLRLNEIRGFIPGKITQFLLNTHISRRSIYLSRHGQSEYNVTGQLGGDSKLTARGRAYALSLADYFRREFASSIAAGVEPTVWSSQLTRATQTVEHLPAELCMRWRALNEINAGICEHLTYDEIRKRHPGIAEKRKADKLRYRYPGGESYVDVIHRLEPAILELERHRGDLFVIAHQAVIRTIYGYLMGMKREEVPHIDVPLHTVFKLEMLAYGPQATKINLEKEVAQLGDMKLA